MTSGSIQSPSLVSSSLSSFLEFPSMFHLLAHVWIKQPQYPVHGIQALLQLLVNILHCEAEIEYSGLVIESKEIEEKKWQDSGHRNCDV